MKRSLVVCLVCVTLAFPTLANSARASDPVKITATHPLEPLSAPEMKAAYEIVKAYFTSDPNLPHNMKKLRFPTLVLSEPPKQTVLAWKTGDMFPRVAHVEVLDDEINRTWVALVDLRQSKLVSLELIPKGAGQPALTTSEIDDGEEIVRNYKPWQDAMRKRKLDPDRVYLDVWAPGDAPLPDEVVAKLQDGENTRLFRYLSFDRGTKHKPFNKRHPQNPYDRPIEGVVVTVDMNKREVAQMTDTVMHPVSTESGNATESDNAPAMVKLKPLTSAQPQGSDIKLQGKPQGKLQGNPQGGLVRWHNWQFYVALHPREGLVLYDVRFNDHSTWRPIAYRMALSEIYVYYGLGDENWVWRSAFEVGEYNAGILAQALEVNRDIPENAKLLDAVFFNDKGPDAEYKDGGIPYPDVVALYERDAGILWSRTHPEPDNDGVYGRETRYARELVVTWNCWIGNYIYSFDWIFKLDGSIETRVLLTGTTLNRGTDAAIEASAPKVGKKDGVLVAAPYHQHFFSFRLDLDVDGPINRLMEMEVANLPDTGFKNSFAPTMQYIEREGFRDANPSTLRHWHVEGSSTNAFGKPTSYALEPGGVAVPYAASDFQGLARGAFAQHQLWATQYKEGELYAAGPFPNQSKTAAGLPEFVKDAASLAQQDVVLWYTMGYTHLTRPEDYPVMPAETISSFRLVPQGFFTRNPALDVADQSR
jgi:primary-amine oxidase